MLVRSSYGCLRYALDFLFWKGIVLRVAHKADLVLCDPNSNHVALDDFSTFVLEMFLEGLEKQRLENLVDRMRRREPSDRDGRSDGQGCRENRRHGRSGNEAQGEGLCGGCGEGRRSDEVVERLRRKEERWGVVTVGVRLVSM